VLAVIEFPGGFAINVRAARSLFRPSHFFAPLKQGDLESLDGCVRVFVARQMANGDWPRIEGRARQLRFFAAQTARTFARMTATFEREYVFCWLDWDGDNVLADGGIVDYGSVRQFGLFHREYRFEDVDRMSTSLPEQRRKARHIVQNFAQIRDFLLSGRKRPLASFRNDPILALFDQEFARTKSLLLLRQVGLAPALALRVLRQEPERLARLSLIDEGSGNGTRRVRMANLACVGSMAVNGVAALHTELIKDTVLRDFHDMWPEKFHNETNGVTPRRFIALANPPLASLIEKTIGGDWLNHPERLEALEQHAQDAAFRERWRAIKRLAKERLSNHLSAVGGVALDPDALFDVHVKRIHEYKRQHLNLLHVIALYLRLKQDPGLALTPRAFVFGGKAAPGYRMAKLIIKLINSVADVINRDRAVASSLRVVFVPDFDVKVGERVYPAADLSEQISTAGKEASGTGNMKFMMNGALTIGTLDGANVEIREAVGERNFFSFGKTVAEIADTWAQGYRPREIYEQDAQLRAVIDRVDSGLFSHGDPTVFRPLTENLLSSDPFLVCADFRAYVDCQDRVGTAYREAEEWTRMSIANVARSGRFSSDRAIRGYNEDIWHAAPLRTKAQAAHRAGGTRPARASD